MSASTLLSTSCDQGGIPLPMDHHISSCCRGICKEEGGVGALRGQGVCTNVGQQVLVSCCIKVDRCSGSWTGEVKPVCGGACIANLKQSSIHKVSALQAVLTSSLEAGVRTFVFPSGDAGVARVAEWSTLARFEALFQDLRGVLSDAEGQEVSEGHSER